MVDSLEWIKVSLTVTSNEVLLPTFPEYQNDVMYAFNILQTKPTFNLRRRNRLQDSRAQFIHPRLVA